MQEFECLENDVCLRATRVESLPFSGSVALELATSVGSSVPPCYPFDPQSKGVFYEVGGSDSTCLTALVMAVDFDTGLAVYAGDCNQLSCVGSRVVNFGTTMMTWSPATGSSYKVVLAAIGDAKGTANFTIKVKNVIAEPQ